MSGKFPQKRKNSEDSEEEHQSSSEDEDDEPPNSFESEFLNGTSEALDHDVTHGSGSSHFNEPSLDSEMDELSERFGNLILPSVDVKNQLLVKGGGGGGGEGGEGGGVLFTNENPDYDLNIGSESNALEGLFSTAGGREGEEQGGGGREESKEREGIVHFTFKNPVFEPNKGSESIGFGESFNLNQNIDNVENVENNDNGKNIENTDTGNTDDHTNKSKLVPVFGLSDIRQALKRAETWGSTLVEVRTNISTSLRALANFLNQQITEFNQQWKRYRKRKRSSTLRPYTFQNGWRIPNDLRDAISVYEEGVAVAVIEFIRSNPALHEELSAELQTMQYLNDNNCNMQ